MSDRLRWVLLGPVALVVGYIGGSYAKNLVVGRMSFRQVLGLIPPNSPHPLPTLAAVITGRCVGVLLLVATAYGIAPARKAFAARIAGIAAAAVLFIMMLQAVGSARISSGHEILQDAPAILIATALAILRRNGVEESLDQERGPSGTG